MVKKKTTAPQQSKEVSSFNLRPMTAAIRVTLTGVLAGTLSQPVQAELPVAAQNWVGSGAAEKAISGNKMNITQHTDKVVLNWQSFNIGVDNHVNYAQPGSNSVALNRIGQNDPSRILGKLTANGQLYLINKNGFIFGEKAVIDVNSLIASTHDISDDVFERGITRVFDESGEAAFVLDEAKIAANQNELKKILVESGAKITADDNGRIILVAPDVENSGTLNGGEQSQIMLVASQDKVYLQQADSEDFAGLLVEVDTGGKVSNFGNILAKQGNITMAGFAVNQAGRVNATTSVNINGSIRLLAREGHTTDGLKLVGTKTTRTIDRGDGLGKESHLTFAENSLTTITPDSSAGTAVDEQQQPVSYLEASAHTIKLESGSAIVAPAANVEIVATDNILNPLAGNSGRIEIEQGSLIDVSGIEGVKVAMERNVVEVDVRSYELRDSPLQRGGILNAKDVYVDIRKDTDMVDISGAKARIKRSIQERMTQGGDLKLTASGEVTVEDGAVLDISGGSVDYMAGEISTTQLVSQAGVQYDISEADAEETFVSLFREAHNETGYREGKDAGSLTINTSVLDWQGDLSAGVSNGRLQRIVETMARGGRFEIDLATFFAVQDFSFGNDKETNQLLASGLQDFRLKTFGSVTVEENAKLTFAPFSNVDITAGSIDVEGQIYVPGRYEETNDAEEVINFGGISLTALFDDALGTTGRITLGRRSVLDVSGRWINDYQTILKGLEPRSPLAIDGGKVILESEGDLTLERGARILANGGAQYTTSRKLVEGEGGEISLSALGKGRANPALLTLDGSLSAQALLKNGTLTLASNNIVIGDRSYSDSDEDTTYIAGNDSIFSRFSTVTLKAVNHDVILTGAAHIDTRQQNRILQTGFDTKADRRSLDGMSSVQRNPQYLRQAGTLNLEAKNNIEMHQGSSILAEIGSSINFTAKNSIFVDGSISAPAGAIAFNILADGGQFNPAQAVWLGKHASIVARGAVDLLPDPYFRVGEVLNGGTLDIVTQRGYIVVEKGARIDLSGTSAVLDIAVNGDPALGVSAQKIGSDAGKITLKAAEGIVMEGSIVAKAGSSTARGGTLVLTLDRSSRQDPLNILPAPELQIALTETADFNFSSLNAFGDSIDSGRQGKATLYTDLLTGSGITDLQLNTPDTIVFNGDIALSMAHQIQLDARKLSWRAIPGKDAGTVRLEAPYLTFQHTLKDIDESKVSRVVNGSPEYGDGIFVAEAGWMELAGAFMLDGFKQVDLSSDNDLMLRGVLTDEQKQRDYIGEMVTAADLNLRASQIYPSTLSEYSFTVANKPDGVITISGNQGDSHLPLSAGGTLAFNAPHIKQSGVIRAPLGSIKLNASDSLELTDGSITSVSADGLLIPFGVTEAGLDWLYPIGSVSKLVYNSAPDKRIVLSGKEIDLAEGSVVDLSGGGDLFAYEFVPGLGGSYDYLQSGSPSYQGGFAILPELGASLAPFDHFQSSREFNRGESVYLEGGNGLAAGFYTKLPAHYALLPGAYLVTPVSGSQDQALTSTTIGGRQIVSGFTAIAGTRVRDARKSGFMLENGAQVRQHSEYLESTGDAFFVQQALANETATPLLARDSGLISILAQTRLALNAKFEVNAQFGRGALMDIAAKKIDVVEALSGNQNGDVLEILASDLNGLSIDSLLLGGGRSSRNDEGETEIDVIADDVRIKSGSVVEVADLIVAANQHINVETGAELIAMGSANTGDSMLAVKGDGALLRVSAADQVGIRRTYNSGQLRGQKGELNIAAGALLQADRSMLLDASRSTTISGDIVMDGGSLNLAANEINLGNVEGLSGNGALNLSNEDLARLTVEELILTSRKTVNLLGDVGLLQNDGTLAALGFERLYLDAMGLIGVAGDQSASIKASEIALQNTQNEQQTLDLINNLPASAAGTLNIEAEKLTTGTGTFALGGFDTVNLTASRQFNANAQGELRVVADLNLATPVITAAGKGDLHIDARGYDAVLSSTGMEDGAISEELTGAIKVTADAVTLDTKVVMPSGRLQLHALNGDAVLGNEADVDLAGRQILFDDVLFASNGGILDVTADHGDIRFNSESVVDLNGGVESVDGGTLKLSALEGSVELAGNVSAQHGEVDIDSARFNGPNGFNNMVNKLADAGIDRHIRLRTRLDDMVLAKNNSLSAQQVSLTADNGLIEIQGSIIADADDGGSIDLSAGDRVILADGGLLSARAEGSKGGGGSVSLNSIDADRDGIHGIELRDGGTIDVSGAETAEDGRIVLRALRVDSDGNGSDDDINIAAIDADIKGVSEFYAEAVKIYRGEDLQVSGQIKQADITRFKNETDQYMTVADRQNTETRLGKGIHLRPGIEVQREGDLRLAAELNTADWRYASIWDSADQTFDPVVGQFVMRASNDLNIDRSISDGFQSLFGSIDQLKSDSSWSFNLVSGADLNSARTEDVIQGSGDINIGEVVHIRTGTGDIGLHAGKDINFKDVTSVVYNAGRADKIKPYGSLDFDTFIVSWLFIDGTYAEYPIDGGDLSLTAAGNINGKVNVNQYTNDWLVRYQPDKEFLSSQVKPTVWGIDAAKFNQNLGSFGGGNVSIDAEADINNLSVMMPLIGKQVGTPTPNSFGFSFDTNEVEILGGGNMSVFAGGDIAGGSFLLGKGWAEISAAGSIKGSSENANGPLLSMGDSQFKVFAGDDVAVTGVTDPMMADEGNVNFFSYSSDSKLEVTALSGDIRLGAKRDNFSGVDEKDSKHEALTNVYPASLIAVAAGGSITAEHDIVLYPSAQGDLMLLAKEQITSAGGRKWVILSDADSTLLPDENTPVTTTQINESVLAGRLSVIGTRELIHAAVPVHLHDGKPVKLVTLAGNIGEINFNLAKHLELKAGRDLTNTQLLVQNVSADDLTSIEASRDIRFPILRGDNGSALNNDSRIEVAGPGYALVKAGRNIDLGRSTGISTVGDQINPALADQGADLMVMAGINSAIGYSAFWELLEESGAYYLIGDLSNLDITDDPEKYIAKRNRDGLFGEPEIYAQFSVSKLIELMNSTSWTWSEADYARLTLPIFYKELVLSGSNGDIARGFDAIDALLPGDDWQGDLNLFFSKIHTVDGGDIGLFVPGGNINVGLSATGGEQKSSSELGIVAQQQGSINAFLSEDFNVNQSRVFALGGSDEFIRGDILVWSSFGDIDAGRGAKSALAVPPPETKFDEEGNLVTEFPPAISGSGIRTAESGGREPGDVALFAPNGVINAGEAGIGGNNITLVAKAVLGASNIDVGGVSSGVPTQTATASPAAGVSSNSTANASKVAENSVQNDTAGDDEQKMALGMLSVEVVGFGSDSGNDSESAVKQRCVGDSKKLDKADCSG